MSDAVQVNTRLELIHYAKGNPGEYVYIYKLYGGTALFELYAKHQVQDVQVRESGELDITFDILIDEAKVNLRPRQWDTRYQLIGQVSFYLEMGWRYGYASNLQLDQDVKDELYKSTGKPIPPLWKDPNLT